MQPPHQHLRIDLAELKSQIIKKLGPERSKQYLDYMNKLLSLKISKAEFNKICLQIVGRENIPLHNQFVRSILKNACNAKVPPPIRDKDGLKSQEEAATKETPSDACQLSVSHASKPLVLSNGHVLPLSPQNAISGIRDRKGGDCLSALGTNGKTDFASQQSKIKHENKFDAFLKNGDLTPSDTRRWVKHHQGTTKQEENKREVLCHLKDQNVVVEGGKEVPTRSLLRAPLGIPLCPVSVGGSHKATPLVMGGQCSDIGGLLETKTLREHMEMIATTQGLEGVTMDCANLLNKGLEAYLKGLIRSCNELAGTKSAQEPKKNSTHKHKARGKLVNGVRPGYHVQRSNGPTEAVQEQRTHCPITLLDFRVAMELNPHQLGEDWPLMLERICTQSFVE